MVEISYSVQETILKPKMAGRGMFRDAQKGITAKQFDELGNEVSFDVREDEEMVRIAHVQVIYTTCTCTFQSI